MIKHVVNYGGTMPIRIFLNRAHSQKEGVQALERFQKVVLEFLKSSPNLMGILPEDPTVT